MTEEQEEEYWREADLWVTKQEATKRKYEVQATWTDEGKHRGVTDWTLG